MLVGPCLIVAAAMMASTAQAGAPRWYGKRTGALVPYGGNAGLVELGSPESLQGVAQIKLMTTKLSLCLIKSQESIANPSSALSPGTGEMEEFEAVCEEGTGPGPNEAAPFPCINGEAFEVRGLNLDWPSTLEVGSSEQGRAASRKHGNAKAHPSTLTRKLPKYYDNFANISVELSCLKSKQHAEYHGSLRPEVEVGRLTFRGVEDGQLEDSSGHSFSLKGGDFFTQKSYKDVRVNSEYHERPTISSLAPASGPASGGTEITIQGSGFTVGTEMKIYFGQTPGRSVDCPSTTECAVTSPPHKVGKVRTRVVVGTTMSRAEKSDLFAFQ
jgi:hypothetical protein